MQPWERPASPPITSYVLRLRTVTTSSSGTTTSEARRYQVPLEGQNFKHDNKLVYKLLKAACVGTTNAWVWIQKNDPSADGRKAWLALVAHYDSYGKLNNRVQEPKWSCQGFIIKTKRTVSSKSTSQDLSNNSVYSKRTSIQVSPNCNRLKFCSMS